MCSQEFGKSKYEQPGPIVEVDEESERAGMLERIRLHLEHASPGPWEITDGNLVVGADRTPIARLDQPWTVHNCAMVACAPKYIGFLLSQLAIAREKLLEAEKQRDSHGETIVLLGADLERATAELDELRTNNAALGLMAVESVGKASTFERERDALQHKLDSCAVALDAYLPADGSILGGIEQMATDAQSFAQERNAARLENANLRVELNAAVRAREILDEERTTTGVKAVDLTAKNHALREEREHIKSVVWTLNNALTTYHDFTSELLEAQRLASQIPGLYATEDELPPPPEVVVDVKFESCDSTARRLRKAINNHPGIVGTCNVVPSL